MIAKSWIYVPGDRPDRFAKAATCGANAVLIDLEDAVFDRNKGIARENVVQWLASRQPSNVAIWVRVNSGDRGAEDVVAVARPGLTGICLPKTGSLAQIVEVADLLQAAEVRQELPRGMFKITPLVETASALIQINEIASAPRVSQLQIGEVDLAADMGIEVGEKEFELLYARSMVVMASAATGILPPVGAVSTDFKNLADLRASSMALKAMGFVGRACIHPAQVEVVNDVFSPTTDEVTRAQDVLGRLSSAAREGSGLAIDVNGKMIDEASARWARRVLGLGPPTADASSVERSRG